MTHSAVVAFVVMIVDVAAVDVVVINKNNYYCQLYLVVIAYLKQLCYSYVHVFLAGEEL